MQTGEMGPPPGTSSQTTLVIDFVISAKRGAEEKFKKL
jgi:hypothetical protein